MLLSDQYYTSTASLSKSNENFHTSLFPFNSPFMKIPSTLTLLEWINDNIILWTSAGEMFRTRILIENGVLEVKNYWLKGIIRKSHSKSNCSVLSVIRYNLKNFENLKRKNKKKLKNMKKSYLGVLWKKAILPKTIRMSFRKSVYIFIHVVEIAQLYTPRIDVNSSQYKVYSKEPL